EPFLGLRYPTQSVPCTSEARSELQLRLQPCPSCPAYSLLLLKVCNGWEPEVGPDQTCALSVPRQRLLRVNQTLVRPDLRTFLPGQLFRPDLVNQHVDSVMSLRRPLGL